MNKNIVILEITEEDILMGERGDSSFCPIANAGRRVFNRKVTVARDFRVYSAWWEYIWYSTWKAEYKLPKEAKEFMYQFDIGNPVEPITIELRCY